MCVLCCKAEAVTLNEAADPVCGRCFVPVMRYGQAPA